MYSFAFSGGTFYDDRCVAAQHGAGKLPYRGLQGNSYLVARFWMRPFFTAKYYCTNTALIIYIRQCIFVR